jgi:hypothetical protein
VVFAIATNSFPNWITQLSQQEELFSISRETLRWVSSSNAIIVIQSATSTQENKMQKLALELLPDGDDYLQEQMPVSATTTSEETDR